MADVTRRITTKRPKHRYTKKRPGEEREFFRSILENSLSAIAVVDKKGIIQYESPSMEQVLGCRLGERVGASGFELVHPEDMVAATEALLKLAQHPEQSIVKDVQVKHADGSWRTLQVYGRNLLKDPIVRGIIAVFNDISERKLIEKKLAESEEQHRALAEAASKSGLGVTILQNKQDMEAAIVLANDIGSKMTGFSIPELLSMTAWDLINPQDLSVIEGRYRLRQKGFNPPDVYETSLRCKDGTFFPVEASVSTLFYQGKIATVVCFRDITERKKAEQKLLESELKYRTLVESSREGIIISKGTQILLANKALLNMLGVASLKELGKIPPLNFVAPDSHGRILERIEKRNKKEPLNPVLETRLVCRNGEIRDFEISTVEINLADGQYVLSILHDITERKTAERMLSDSHEQLRSLSTHLEVVREEERTTIAREIHDDLGQSLVALKMDLAAVRNRACQDPKIVSEKIQLASEAVDTIIQRVRSISAVLRPGLLDDLGLVPAIEWQVKEFQNSTGIKCSLRLEYGNGGLDRHRATGFFRVLKEALTNISLHSNAKTVRVTLKERDGILTLKVQDDGRGITEEQIKNPRSFGLVGMRERAHALGGEFQIQGHPNRGTTLLFSVPLARGDDAAVK